MIIISELRVGNILHFKGDAKNGWNDEQDVVVGEIKEGELFAYHYTCYHRIDCRRCYEIKPYDYFESAPLTEEWLLRFGFKKDYDGFLIKETGRKSFRISTGEGNHVVYKHDIGMRWNAIHNGLDFVHQLQNLYQALTGEELKLSEP